mmetsp:Transcript_11268/g.19701  ORF Transcript_11268/g.19701 Transcript_11268/m.19701 type:complete len:101 (-) Transcript_11268:6-308(-)
MRLPRKLNAGAAIFFPRHPLSHASVEVAVLKPMSSSALIRATCTTRIERAAGRALLADAVRDTVRACAVPSTNNTLHIMLSSNSLHTRQQDHPHRTRLTQ